MLRHPQHRIRADTGESDTSKEPSPEDPATAAEPPPVDAGCTSLRCGRHGQEPTTAPPPPRPPKRRRQRQDRTRHAWAPRNARRPKRSQCPLGSERGYALKPAVEPLDAVSTCGIRAERAKHRQRRTFDAGTTADRVSALYGRVGSKGRGPNANPANTTGRTDGLRSDRTATCSARDPGRSSRSGAIPNPRLPRVRQAAPQHR